MGKVTKPPLGIIPMEFWVNTRMVNLRAAIARYKAASLEVPAEWYVELNLHYKKYKPTTIKSPD